MALSALTPARGSTQPRPRSVVTYSGHGSSSGGSKSAGRSGSIRSGPPVRVSNSCRAAATSPGSPSTSSSVPATALAVQRTVGSIVAGMPPSALATHAGCPPPPGGGASAGRATYMRAVGAYQDIST